MALLLLMLYAAVMLRRRTEPVVDRVAVFDTFLGGATPRIARSLPADPDKAARTFQRIGRVALMSKMSACDDVTRGPFFTDRDLGDENDARGHS